MWILHQERMIEMGLFGKGNILNMMHHEGLPGYSDKTAITMELDEENRCLIFKARAFKKAGNETSAFQGYQFRKCKCC